jgi:hypothetical protein
MTKVDYFDDVTIVFRNELRMFLWVIMLFCNIRPQGICMRNISIDFQYVSI